MCLVYHNTIIQRDELPKFNGRSVDSIYAVYANSRYGKDGWYVADILYYNIHFRKEWKSTVNVISIHKLPPEFEVFFGKVENKGKKIFVTNLRFRERDSANGSFCDESLSIGGWAGNSTNDSLSIYRGGGEYTDKPENKYVIDIDGELGKSIMGTLNTNFTVDTDFEFANCPYTLEEGSLDFATKYPYEHTPIRIIDGLVYPDEKLPSWRWLHGMPYRTPDGDTDKKHLRIWDEDLKRHIYVEKTETVEEGEEGLISISFPYKSHEIYGSEGNAYCHVRRYNESCNYVFETYTIKKINKKGNYPVVMDSYRGMTKMKSNLRCEHTDLYRITKIF